MTILQGNVPMTQQVELLMMLKALFKNVRYRSDSCIRLCRWRGLLHGFKHVTDKNKATTFLSNHKRGGTSQIKHDKILTAKQAEFVNKELSASNNTISIKKIVTSNTSEETELDNAYQKALIAGIENKVEHSDKKKSPAQMKEWSILSDHIKYITSDRSETFNNLSIDPMN